MVKNTADAATALFVAHVAKKVSRYIYGQVDKYLKELKEQNSDERAETSDKDIMMNPRCKKKKEIRYEESSRQVLKNTRFSELYTMLLDIYQLTYLQQESTLADREKNKVPIHNRHVPFFMAMIILVFIPFSMIPFPPITIRQTLHIFLKKSRNQCKHPRKKGKVLHDERVQERTKKMKKLKRHKKKGNQFCGN
jgi:hypothetical protein